MKRYFTLLLILFVAVGFLAAASIDAQSEEYPALEGLNSIKAVFDVRAENPNGLELYLKLIHDTFNDKNIQAVSEKRDFVIVFMGPAVKLISKNRTGLTPGQSKALDQIAGTISVMSKDGIRFEVCMFAAKHFQVEPSSILPEIKQVGNGWISLIAYEAANYSLVPVY